MGQALISLLDEDGVPTIVEQAGVLPPRSSMSAATEEDIKAAIADSPLAERYNESEDRRSAFEVLSEEQAEAKEQAEKEAKAAEKEKERKEKEKAKAKKTSSRSTSTRKRQSALEKAVNKTITTTANTVGRELGKQLIRGLFGNLKR